MVSHHPAKFGGHRHYGSGDMMFVVVEEQDSCLDPPLLFSMWHAMLTYTKFQDIDTIICSCLQ